MTRARIETKYRVPAGQIDEVVARLPLAEAEHYRMTSVYLDRPDRALSRAARAAPRQSTRIRLRQYLTGSRFVWVEIKTRLGFWTWKSRFRIEPGAVEPLLRGEEIALEDPGCACEHCRRDASEAYRRLRETAEGPLLAIGAVYTWRQVFTHGDAPFRISLDQDIGYFELPGLVRGDALRGSPEGLGARLLREPGGVLEIKALGVVPEWGHRAVRDLERVDYSKFRTLLRCVEDARREAHHVG